MDPVIFIRLAVPPVSSLHGFNNHTSLLTGQHRFSSLVVLGSIDPSLHKEEPVSGIFNQVPDENGTWTLEIAVELPDLLPSLGDKSELLIHANPNVEGSITLCVSNRMSRFHFFDGNEPFHVLLPRSAPFHGVGHTSLKDGHQISGTEELLRTMVAARFEISGESAEHAFESSIRHCGEQFLKAVDRLLQAVRECDPSLAPMTRSIKWDAAPPLYLLMSGRGYSQGTRLALSGARVFLNPSSLDANNMERFHDIATGAVELDDVDRLVGEARSSLEAGEYEFAFLQAVIAAEVTTARALHNECLRRGISKTKLGKARKEMTYSWALNVGLKLAFGPDIRPAESLITAMNVARDKRNDLMHEAKFEFGRRAVLQLIEDTRRYISAIRSAESV